MLLLAERKLDHAVGVRSFRRSACFSSADAHVVDLQTALLAIARRASPFDAARPAFDEGGEHADARVEIGARERRRVGKRSASRAFLEGLARGVGGFIGGVAAMHQRGRFGGEHFLRLVDLGALERGEPRDLVERQHR